ncbi:MAG TPA: GNAT family N-acetyltransferase [Acidimicrobiales bacterium]|jgi:2'-5' RNA ligase|nr:GNAT family N-acetyltransferase [Acidimicrobiales bacterium]
MPDRLRLGVALLLPAPIAHEVDGLRRALDDRSRERIPPHLTLVPPVNVRRDRLSEALGVLRAAAAGAPAPLVVTLGPPATFLPDNPVVYLPVSGDGGDITALRDRVWKPPLVRSLTWPFVAHVTLADDMAPARIDAALAALGGFRVEVPFDAVSLLIERRPGPFWVPLADAALGPPAVVAGGPLAVELVRSRHIDPEGLALLAAEAVEAPPAAELVVTARREGSVVGVAWAWRTPDGCRAQVLVDAAHRRQGIGRFLDNALEMAVAGTGWGCRYPRLTGSG